LDFFNFNPLIISFVSLTIINSSLVGITYIFTFDFGLFISASIPRARSDCLNDLGALSWEFNFRDVALVYWRLAIKEYPKNIKAKENLKNCSNKYGEPASPNKLFDDIYHFQKIHTRKYFEIKDKIEFSSPEEVNKIVGIINETWNKYIDPEKDKLDTFSVDEINIWFESFDFNFSNQ
jgi:hypothetical protein